MDEGPLRPSTLREGLSYLVGKGAGLRAAVLDFGLRATLLTLPVPQLAGENLQDDKRIQQVIFQVMPRQGSQIQRTAVVGTEEHGKKRGRGMGVMDPGK